MKSWGFLILLLCGCVAGRSPRDVATGDRDRELLARESAREVLARYLREGGPLPEAVQTCAPPMREAIERQLSGLPLPTEQDYRGWVAMLGAPTARERDAASRALENAGPAVLPWIRKDLWIADEPEVRDRLVKAARRLRVESERLQPLRRILARVYAEQPDFFWRERILALPPETALDACAWDLVCALPVETLKQQLALTPAPRRLDIILRILRERPSDELVQSREDPHSTAWRKELNEFDPLDVLAACARYWPVELESLSSEDGAHVAGRNGKSAEEVLRLTRRGVSVYIWRAAKAGNGTAENLLRLHFGSLNGRICVVMVDLYRCASLERTRMAPLRLWKGRSYWDDYGYTWRTEQPPALNYLRAN